MNWMIDSCCVLLVFCSLMTRSTQNLLIYHIRPYGWQSTCKNSSGLTCQCSYHSRLLHFHLRLQTGSRSKGKGSGFSLNYRSFGFQQKLTCTRVVWSLLFFFFSVFLHLFFESILHSTPTADHYGASCGCEASGKNQNKLNRRLDKWADDDLMMLRCSKHLVGGATSFREQTFWAVRCGYGTSWISR